MSNDDDTLGTALWLVAGGAAGYAAARWLVAPHLSPPPAAQAVGPSPSPPPAPKLAAAPASPRALASGPFVPTIRASSTSVAGPSGDLQPIDPYAPSPGSFVVATGPSGDQQPIDPYAGGPAGPQSTLAISVPPFVPMSSTMNGPVTRPSQVDHGPASAPLATNVQAPAAPRAPTSSPQFATPLRVRRFDSVFDRYRGGIPLEYVRALVDRESDGQPSVRAGSAIGLMQIVPVVLDDYNKRHGSAYTSEHLTDPATNVAIGCELLRIIIASYRKNHPRIRTLQADWNNPAFVELLTLGWNAGFSEAGGVGRVARYLEGLGAIDIDLDQVSAHAKLAGATKHLSNPAKIAWCKSVAALYLRERALRSSPTSTVATAAS